MSDLNFRFFTLKPETKKEGNFSYKYPKVRTTGDSGVDNFASDFFANTYIDVTKFAWRNNKLSDAYEVPSIILQERELNLPSWVQNINQILTAGKGIAKPGSDPYQILYTATETGFVYSLPYLKNSGESINGNISNNWAGVYGKNGFFESIVKESKKFGSIISAGGGVEEPKKFLKTNERDIVVEFPLYNTLDTESTLENFSFVSLFSLQNLKLRDSITTYIPPKIYVVSSVGVGGVYMPAAYVSKLDIKSIGTTRLLRDIDSGFNGASNGGVLIPEAYKVSITLTDLIEPSANILAGSLGFDPVSVIAPPVPQAAGAAPAPPPTGNFLTRGVNRLLGGNR
jgi:hypothetical protein